MLAAGTTLGIYRIVAPLGAGGMGEVYRAHDPRLERDIALKILPESLTADATARARLIREARSSAALSHPNICMVHEVGEAGGHVYIAMELVEGQPLSERIGGRPLPVESVIRYGTQIAEALAHAHERHVIHRDLKSGNVMITHEGRVKVLDFGLAKRVWDVDENPPMQPQVTLTETGVVVGTPHYLAPEVLHGAKADVVSDVWALGVVLYEMASGTLPFRGGTTYELSAAIMNETPAPLPQRVPAALRAVIAGCLAKQPGERSQRAGEVRAALEALRTDSREVSGGDRARPRRVVWAAASLIAIVIVATAAWLAWLRVAPKRPLVERQLTSNPYEIRVLCAALSPDGKYVAYSDSIGVHLRDIGSGETRQIPLPPGVRYGYPSSWSPDGSKFFMAAESSNDDTTGGIWEISLLGWAVRQLRPNGDLPSMSPDGSRIAFLSYHDDELWLMGADGDDARRVLRFDRGANWVGRPVWSPDGNRIAFAFDHDAKDSVLRSIECLDVKSGQTTTLLKEQKLLTAWPGWGVWMPDGRIVYAQADSLRSRFSGTTNLWQIKVDAQHGRRSSEPKQVTSWSDGQSLPANASEDGKQLLYIKLQGSRDVYVAGIIGAGAMTEPPRRLTLSGRSDCLAGWTSDGSAVFFISDREGTPRLFRQRVDQSNPERLVATPGWDRTRGLGRTSPDGVWLYYWRSPGGVVASYWRRELTRVATTGGPAERVLDSAVPMGVRCALWPDSTCVMGELSADTLIVSRLDPRGGRGGEMARIRARDVVTDWTSWDWDLSPDASRIAVIVRDTIRVLDLRSREVSTVVLKNANEVLRQGEPSRISWAPSGRGFLLTNNLLYYVDLSGQARVLFRESPGVLVPSPDGRRIAFDSWQGTMNAWLLQGF